MLLFMDVTVNSRIGALVAQRKTLVGKEVGKLLLVTADAVVGRSTQFDRMLLLLMGLSCCCCCGWCILDFPTS